MYKFINGVAVGLTAGIYIAISMLLAWWFWIVAADGTSWLQFTAATSATIAWIFASAYWFTD